MTRRLQGGVEHHIRIGASEMVLKDHLPLVARAVREKIPGLRMTLREAYRSTVVGWLEKDEVDLGFTLLGDELPAMIRAVPLVRIPLVLLVKSRSRIRSADELWQMDRIDESLITLSTYEEVSRSFQQGLAARNIDWFASIEVSSLDLIRTYVAEGYGIGLFLGIPGMPPLPGTRVIPLPGFEPVTFGAMWRGKPGPTVRAFLLAMFVRARELAGGEVLRNESDLLKLLDSDKAGRGGAPGERRHAGIEAIDEGGKFID
jgi:DNA-binding transcriptional LysR family regulator